MQNSSSELQSKVYTTLQRDKSSEDKKVEDTVPESGWALQVPNLLMSIKI